MFFLNQISPLSDSALTYQSFILEYKTILISAIISLALSVVLRTFKILLLQIIFFLGVIVFGDAFTSVVYNLFIVFQVLLVLFLLYKIKKALDRNYTLILEKTHQIPRNITRNGQTGSQSSFI